MALPNGRLLGYAVMGDRAGFPVLVLHGTPGSPGSSRAWTRPPASTAWP